MLRTTIHKAARQFGYDIVKLGRAYNIAGTPIDIEHDNDFISLYDRCSGLTLAQVENVYAIHQAVKHVVRAGVPGDFVECGVWRGGGAMMMASTLLQQGVNDRRLYLYDTYEGMSAPTAKDVDLHGVAASARMTKSKRVAESIWAYVPLDEVKRNLARTGYPADLITYVKGRVEETIPATMPARIALLRLDTDFYESTLHNLKHLYPLLNRGGILIIDDYGHWQGAKTAVDEYFAEIGEVPFLSRVEYGARMTIKA